MARKRPRPYGTGALVELKGGMAIRWWETVVGEGGQASREMQYENLGPVTKKEAEARLQEKQQTARRRGPRRDLPIPLFSELAARYERDILSMLKFSVRTVRTTNLKHHLLPRFGNHRISTIGPAEVQRFFTELRETGYTVGRVRHDYAPHTLHDIRTVLRGVMECGVKWYRQPVDPLTGVPSNPVSDIRLPKLKAKRKKWALTPDQAGRLIGELKGKAKVMAALAMLSGMRRGEILAIRLQDIAVRTDADNRRFGVISVNQASYLGHIDTPKTEAGVRAFEVHSWVLELIEDWIARSRKRKPEELLFGTRTKRLENSNNILRRHIYPACEKIGVPRADWLTFRRSFQTFAHNENIPARTIADIVGHSGVDTQHIYIQSQDRMKRVAADQLGNKLCKIVQIFEGETALVN